MAIDWKYVKCIMTNSTCYKMSYKMRGGPKAILWHDTGCCNKTIRRYVQPLTSDKDYQNIINIIGKTQMGMIGIILVGKLVLMHLLEKIKMEMLLHVKHYLGI